MHKSECADLTKESSLAYWNEQKSNYQKYVNLYWLDNKRSNFSRWPKTLHLSNFKQEYKDLIILLRKICGLKDSSDFEPWMYKFMFQIIENKEHIFWGELISIALYQQICNVGTSVPFYMNSYLVYIVATMGSFLGLSTKGDRLQVPIWEYCDQITLVNSKYHYRRVQDAFFGHYRCLFNKQLCIKRVSDVAWEKVNQYGCIFL